MERIGESLNETFEEVLNAIKDYYKELSTVFMDFQEIYSSQQETLILEVENQGMNEQDMETSWDKVEEEDQGIQEKKTNDSGEGGNAEVQSDNMRGEQKEQDNGDCTRGKKARGKKRKRGKRKGTQYSEKGGGGSEMRENREVMKQRREKKERNKKRNFKITRKKKLERWLSRGWKIKIGEIK